MICCLNLFHLESSFLIPCLEIPPVFGLSHFTDYEFVNESGKDPTHSNLAQARLQASPPHKVC